MSVKEYTTDAVKATQRGVTMVSGVIQFSMDTNYVISTYIVPEKSAGIDHTSSYVYSIGTTGSSLDIYLTDYFDECLYGTILVHNNGMDVAAGDTRGQYANPLDVISCPHISCYDHRSRTVERDSAKVSQRGRKANVLSLKFINLINGNVLTPLALAQRPEGGGGSKEIYMMLWYRNSTVA